MTIDKLIREEVLKILSEDEKSGKPKKDEKKKEKTVKAKPGRGRVKTYIKQAKARASDDPQGLMKSLRVDPGRAKLDSAPTFEEKVERLIRSAIMGTKEMTSAFRGVVLEDSGAYVTMESLGVRDGVMFMNHVIIAAQSANMITLDKDIEVAPAGDKVHIKFIQAK